MQKKINSAIHSFVFIIQIVLIIFAPSIIFAKELNNDKYVPGEIIVRFKEPDLNTKNLNNKELFILRSQNLSVKAKLLTQIENIELKNSLVSSNAVLYEIKGEESVEEIISKLKNNPNIEEIEPNYYYTPASINTNDPSRGLLWALDNTGQVVNSTTGTADADIDAPEAWALNGGIAGSDVIVAIVDNGVAYNHPDLSASMWDGTNCKDLNGNPLGSCIHGYNFTNNTKIPLPWNNSGHATHIAGTIAAQKDNGVGIIGVASNVKIMSLTTDYSWFETAQAIDFATQNGAKIINASYGGGSESSLQFQAIKRFVNGGGLFITVAQNYSSDNDTIPVYPSSDNIDGIISVAATTQNDTLASFSNWGAISVDVGAPGQNIYSTFCTSDCTTENYQMWYGTSMSAPYVSGVAALILGDNPNMNPIGVKNIILSTGDSLASLNNKTLSGKRINAYSARNMLNSLSLYIPTGGYLSDNIIPASQINYSSDTGNIVINFKVKDTYSNLTEILSDFSYSIDGGETWQSPINEDTSVALSDDWTSNNYLSSTDYSGNTYNFTFGSRNTDSTKINNANTNNAKIRFKVSDGINQSSYIESENFSVANFTQTLNISEPVNPVEIDANTYNVVGTTDAGSLVEIYKEDNLVTSLQLESDTTNFSISVPLEQNSVNNFTVKAIDPIYSFEKTATLPSITEKDMSIVISLNNIENLTTPPFVINTSTPTIVVNGEENMICRFDSLDTTYSLMTSSNICTTNGTSASCKLSDQGKTGEKNFYISCIDQMQNETNSENNINISFTLNVHSRGGSSGGGGSARNLYVKNNLIAPSVITPVNQNVSLITKTLRPKMINDEVKKLQSYLNNHGYIISKTGPGSPGFETNYFGLKTKQAVINFQKNNGLKPDGIVGIQTINLIK